MEKVAAVATDEPEIAAKPPQAAIVATPRGDERSHEKEHRDDAESIIGHRAHRGMADDFQRRGAADQIAEAGHTHQTHGHAHWDAQQHQGKQDDKTNNGDGFGAEHVRLTRLV